MHLAEFNTGILKHDWEDRRVFEFTNNLERVSRIAHKSPGFVWQLGDVEMEKAQLDPESALGGNPRIASTLSVWKDADSLKHFVWNTIHKRFVERRHEWFDRQSSGRVVLWWVPKGHRPSLDEAIERLEAYEQNGSTDFAFGWDWLE